MYINGMVEFLLFILVTAELEGVPWWTLLSNVVIDSIHSYSYSYFYYGTGYRYVVLEQRHVF